MVLGPNITIPDEHVAELVTFQLLDDRIGLVGGPLSDFGPT